MRGVRGALMVVTFTIYSSGSPPINTALRAVDISVNIINYYCTCLSSLYLYMMGPRSKCDIDHYASTSFIELMVCC